LDSPEHNGIRKLVRDLNRVYRSEPALHAKDCESEGFTWIDGGDAERSILSRLRMGGAGDEPVAVLCNFTPIPRDDVVVGLPSAGTWTEILCTDAEIYGGSGRGNMGAVEANGSADHGQSVSARVTLPPLSVVMLRQGGDAA